jgi:acetylornithine deacetylase/succinyl-diaminopimelate desuccinylase-like protein
MSDSFKFKRGDKVFVALSYPVYVSRTCPLCMRHGNIEVVTLSGEKRYTVMCPACSGTKDIRKSSYTEVLQVREGVIKSISENFDGTIVYKVLSGITFTVSGEIYQTKEAAEKYAEQFNKTATPVNEGMTEARARTQLRGAVSSQIGGELFRIQRLEEQIDELKKRLQRAKTEEKNDEKAGEELVY